MKRKYFTVAVAIALSTSLLGTSCIGRFQLTNKLLTWNNQVGNKFVNELVFFAFWILPVYEVSALADLLVLNSIEFWSGSNPVAQGKKIIDGKGYTITSRNDGSVVRLDFDSEEQSWSVNVEGNEYELMTFVDDTHVKLPAADGTYRVVELSQDGLYAYEAMAMSALTARVDH